MERNQVLVQLQVRQPQVAKKDVRNPERKPKMKEAMKLRFKLMRNPTAKESQKLPGNRTYQRRLSETLIILSISIIDHGAMIVFGEGRLASSIVVKKHTTRAWALW